MNAALGARVETVWISTIVCAGWRRDISI